MDVNEFEDYSVLLDSIINDFKKNQKNFLSSQQWWATVQAKRCHESYLDKSKAFDYTDVYKWINPFVWTKSNIWFYLYYVYIICRFYAWCFANQCFGYCALMLISTLLHIIIVPSDFLVIALSFFLSHTGKEFSHSRR